jgi:hypothetical protein
VFDQIVLLALLLLAASSASLCLGMFLSERPATGRLAVLEMTVGTSVFCASVGLIFQHYGMLAGIGALIISAVSNRAFSGGRHPRIERTLTWTSAAAFLAYLAHT